MRLTAIVLAAGKGVRFESATPKPLVNIGGKPLIIYSLQVLSSHRDIRDIILVCNKYNKEEIAGAIKRYRLRKIKKLIFGGRRRQDSVLRGLEAIDSPADFVLIHDGVRPFIDRKTVSNVINAAYRSGAAIAGVPVKATIKKVKKSPCHHVTMSPVVEKTLKREELWEIQTPQVFRRDLILDAYRRCGNIDVTDDAMLVEKLGRKVRVIQGSYHNIKITTPEDLVIAQAILKDKKSN